MDAAALAGDTRHLFLNEDILDKIESLSNEQLRELLQLRPRLRSVIAGAGDAL
jgi:hypothetical protein